MPLSLLTILVPAFEGEEGWGEEEEEETEGDDKGHGDGQGALHTQADDVTSAILFNFLYTSQVPFC